jgi:hypothetical protein
LGKTRPVSPSSNSDKQTAHSTPSGWVSGQNLNTGSDEITEASSPRETAGINEAGAEGST